MTESSKEILFFQDTSSHHHTPPDQLLSATVSSGAGRVPYPLNSFICLATHVAVVPSTGFFPLGQVLPAARQPVGNVTAEAIFRDLSDCRWTNPNKPDDAPTLTLHPGMGSLFSLTDTSPEYTSSSR